jgi:F420-non-reducing hydrogenase large subunit
MTIAAEPSTRRITVDPITRLEGHGRIEIFLNEQGQVDRAFFQVPELRGFEKFVQGRPAEDMPQITSRICGVCPTAHHMASTKALDSLYQVTPPPAARKIRELIYHTFLVEDHALHFYFLGGPDFVVGPRASPAQRNIIGVIGAVGAETAQRVIATRRKLRDLMASVAGKAIHPVFGLPGGVAKPVTREQAAAFQAAAAEAVDFGCFSLELFHKVVLANPEYLEMIRSDAFRHETYYMGMVDDQDRAAFYDGMLRVVSPTGHEWAKFPPERYNDYIVEHAEPWSYMKFCHLKALGWQGLVDGETSGIYSVGPLARLNASEGMSTPLAHEAYLKFCGILGGKPVHHTLANHWARLIEMLHAAEKMKELADDPEITDERVRQLPDRVPQEGIGVVEAPRGTLFHHYATDERGLITRANLLVATQNNAGRIALSVEKAARALIQDSRVDEGILNMVEMAFRAYDPCLGCATHSLPGCMPLIVQVRGRDDQVSTLKRGFDGRISRT